MELELFFGVRLYDKSLAAKFFFLLILGHSLKYWSWVFMDKKYSVII